MSDQPFDKRGLSARLLHLTENPDEVCGVEASKAMSEAAAALSAEVPNEDRLYKALRYAVNCHSIDAKLNMPDHQVAQLLVVRGGDWRGNPTGERRVHTRPEDWAEHLHEHTAELADRIEKG